MASTVLRRVEIMRSARFSSFDKPSCPSLYSVRIGLGYRAVGVLKSDHVVWFWVGSHAEYDRLN